MAPLEAKRLPRRELTPAELVGLFQSYGCDGDIVSPLLSDGEVGVAILAPCMCLFTSLSVFVTEQAASGEVTGSPGNPLDMKWCNDLQGWCKKKGSVMD